MRQIGESLEKNLDEKRELSRDIIGKLDQGLKKADESYRRLCDVMRKCGGSAAAPTPPAKETNQTTSSIHALLQKGLTKEEIAQHLGISVGEIELMLRLRPGSGGK
jgi:DNA-binding NarL/FixJ family response regulator